MSQRRVEAVQCLTRAFALDPELQKNFQAEYPSYSTLKDFANLLKK